MKLKKITALILLAVLCLNISVNAISITGSSAIVIDSGNNTYYEKNADVPLAPASMTKVMTAYLVYEAINDGILTKDTLITADYNDYLASIDPEATNVYLAEGQAYSVDELLGAILVPSACAASAMIGKRISGSEHAFAQLMTQTAQGLGLNAYYEDASGLSDNNRITARSMAQLIRIFISKYPDVLNYTSRSTINFGGKTYKSTNHMLPDAKAAYWGVDGFKTGTTTLAGCCFSATAVRDGVRLISVTMHSGYGLNRFSDTAAMLDKGFNEALTRYNNLFSTALKVYINGNEIPAYCYMGSSSYLVIKAEELSGYGFDVHWVSETSSLSLTYNPQKPIRPLDIAPTTQAGLPVLPIYKDIRNVTVYYNGTQRQLSAIHPLSGYIGISADELATIAASSQWDGASGSLSLFF